MRRLLLDTAPAIQEAMGIPPRINPLIDPDLFRRRLAEVRTRPATLAKLFRLGMPVHHGEAEQALAPVGAGVLIDTGLAELEQDQLRLRARISEYEGLLIASDLLGPSQPADVVMGASPAARRVDRLTTRRRVRTALDLGTGPGIQALRAAPHSERVVAVDVSERALAFARFNIALNGVDNVELRQGSWFEPVEGERFDLIVANPPYVVSPDTELLYRDGDLPADAVTEKLVQEAPAHLEDDGFAHVMGNWIHGREEDWRAPLERWVAGSGCDALLLRYPVLDLVHYAAHWNLLRASEGAPPFLAAVDRWLDYYRKEGIEAISDGMVVLRRCAGGGNWVRAIEVPGSPTGHAGDHVQRLFAARDRRDEAARATRFRPAPGLKVSESSLELKNGVGFSVRVPPGLLERLEEVGPNEVTTVRRLFALGLLELA